MVYDSLILLSLAMLYGAVAIAIKYGLLGVHLESGERATLGAISFSGLIFLCVGFYVYFWRRGGQTIGMKAWRLKLQTGDAHAISLSQALSRAFFATLSFLVLGLGYLWSLWQTDKKTWHDLISKTEVVVLPKPQKKTK